METINKRCLVSYLKLVHQNLAKHKSRNPIFRMLDRAADTGFKNCIKEAEKFKTEERYTPEEMAQKILDIMAETGESAWYILDDIINGKAKWGRK